MKPEDNSIKHISLDQHGDSSVLSLKEKDLPEIQTHEVLVEIKAAALNHLDLWIRRGLPGLKIPLPHIPGSDASGIIVEVGADVSGYQPGDEVVIQPGTFCGDCPACQSGVEDMCSSYGILGETEAGVQQEFLALSPENIGPKPERLSFAEAAALPLSALTSWNMLKNRAKLKAGESLLVLGAGSGVGSMAVQMGKHLGARIIATAGSEEKRKLAYSLGADEVLDQRVSGFSKQVKQVTGGRGVDVVFEHIGEAVWQDAVRSLAVGGRLVTCGATTGVNGHVDLRHLFYKRLSILGATMGSLSDFHECLQLAKQGAITPLINANFPFKDIRKAHDHLEFSHAFGKVILEGW